MPWHKERGSECHAVSGIWKDECGCRIHDKDGQKQGKNQRLEVGGQTLPEKGKLSGKQADPEDTGQAEGQCRHR